MLIGGLVISEHDFSNISPTKVINQIYRSFIESRHITGMEQNLMILKTCEKKLKINIIDDLKLINQYKEIKRTSPVLNEQTNVHRNKTYHTDVQQ